MLATWKVLVSMAVVPLLYVAYIFIATVVAYRFDLVPEWRHWLPVYLVFLLPSLGYSALKFGEAGMDVFKSLRPLFLSLWPGNQREVDKLRVMREGISNDLSDIIDEFGPQLYENFNQVSPVCTMGPCGANPRLACSPRQRSRKPARTLECSPGNRRLPILPFCLIRCCGSMRGFSVSVIRPAVRPR